MSTLPEMLKPVAPPAAPERSERTRAPQRDDDAPRFSDNLDAERREEPAATRADDTQATQERAKPADDKPVDDAATTSVDRSDKDDQMAADDVVAGDAALVTAMETAAQAELAKPAAAQAPIDPALAAEPAGLARWFAQASQAEGAGASATNAGLLNKLTSQTSNAALSAGTSAEPDLAAAPSTLERSTAQSGNGPDQRMSFADAMANTANQNDNAALDAFANQAMAKAAPTLEASTAAPALTTGPSVAGSAQSAATAVPQVTTGQAVPVTAIAVEITRQAANGKAQFDIRLDPPELGRLNVRLEVDSAGQTRTHLVVERAETLDMLLTDARSLERALQQAGLKADAGSVSFELAGDTMDGFSQDNQNASNDDQSGNNGSSDEPAFADGNLLTPEDLASPQAIRQQINLTGHLDVRI